MAKDTIDVDGKEVVVREDTAKAYRGTMWILGTVLMIVVIVAVLFFRWFFCILPAMEN